MFLPSSRGERALRLFVCSGNRLNFRACGFPILHFTRGVGRSSRLAAREIVPICCFERVYLAPVNLTNYTGHRASLAFCAASSATCFLYHSLFKKNKSAVLTISSITANRFSSQRPSVISSRVMVYAAPLVVVSALCGTGPCVSPVTVLRSA